MRKCRGKVFIVGAGPGDPGLITVKGLEAIGKADVIIYDRLINSSLLIGARPGAELLYAGKGPSGHTLEQEEINRLLVEKAREGKVVVRLKGGDPFVFGRGGEEAEALAQEGLEFEVVPGITSAIAVPAYAGIPVTHRSLSSSFAVITGREDLAKEQTRIPWEQLAGGVGTLVVLMGAESLPETMRKLLDHGLPADTPAAVVQWGTEPRQRTVQATLADIAQQAQQVGLGAPAVTIVGEVVRLRERLSWFESRPLFDRRVLVTRSREQASALSRQLAELGAEPVELPTIEIQPPEDWAPLDGAVGRLAEYDWAIFTSVNAVEMLWQRLRAARLDARAFARTRLCAIGPATAAALEAHGLRADYVPDNYTTTDVANGLGEASMRDARVLLPRSAIAPEELVRELERRGAQVDQVVAYRTLVPEESRAKARELLADRQVDVVTFSSSSTVQNLVDLLSGDARELLGRATIACIGPVTARTAEGLGLRVGIVAREHTIPGLVEAIVESLAQDPSPL